MSIFGNHRNTFDQKYLNIFSRHIAVVLSFAIIYFIINENIDNAFSSKKNNLDIIEKL